MQTDGPMYFTRSPDNINIRDIKHQPEELYGYESTYISQNKRKSSNLYQYQSEHLIVTEN